jgi:GntR family transcriptional repressor for pyruvate dehydrogenase complex
MEFQLRTIDREKLYTAIVEQLLEGIRSGAFPPGAALPAERMLAVQLGVSRASLREAIRVLEHSGVLDVRTGSGTYVTEDGVSKATMLRAQAALIGEHSPLDVLLARRALEPVCAEHAAIHRHVTDLDELRKNLEEHARLDALGEDPNEHDLAFHLRIAGASHNPVLGMLVERLVETMQQGSWQQLRTRQLQHPGRGRHYVEQHRVILAAIEQNDAAGAGQGMREHLNAVEVGLLAEV